MKQLILDKWHGLTMQKKGVVVACAAILVLVIVL
mgnify:CR=1|jgi:hypothetical protein